MIDFTFIVSATHSYGNRYCNEIILQNFLLKLPWAFQ